MPEIAAAAVYEAYPRQMVDYLVTEYGMIRMHGLPTWQRAEAIVNLAHPLRFRKTTRFCLQSKYIEFNIKYFF